jgi:hypothetical protein
VSVTARIGLSIQRATGVAIDLALEHRGRQESRARRALELAANAFPERGSRKTIGSLSTRRGAPWRPSGVVVLWSAIRSCWRSAFTMFCLRCSGRYSGTYCYCTDQPKRDFLRLDMQ